MKKTIFIAGLFFLLSFTTAFANNDCAKKSFCLDIESVAVNGQEVIDEAIVKTGPDFSVSVMGTCGKGTAHNLFISVAVYDGEKEVWRNTRRLDTLVAGEKQERDFSIENISSGKYLLVIKIKNIGNPLVVEKKIKIQV